MPKMGGIEATQIIRHMDNPLYKIIPDEGVNINTIRGWIGHVAERTIYKSYIFNRGQKWEVEEKVEKAFVCKRQNPGT